MAITLSQAQQKMLKKSGSEQHYDHVDILPQEVYETLTFPDLWRQMFYLCCIWLRSLGHPRKILSNLRNTMQLKLLRWVHDIGMTPADCHRRRYWRVADILLSTERADTLTFDLSTRFLGNTSNGFRILLLWHGVW